VADILATLALLVVAHALCDYPLQGDFLARAKSPVSPLPGIPWQWAMGAHSAIHAGAVWLVTSSWLCAALEFVAHFTIDVLKCCGSIGFSSDQWLHLGCKAAWAVLRG
jgi:hypothetical protein